jgi:hypothetical protein
MQNSAIYIREHLVYMFVHHILTGKRLDIADHDVILYSFLDILDRSWFAGSRLLNGRNRTVWKNSYELP